MARRITNYNGYKIVSTADGHSVHKKCEIYLIGPRLATLPTLEDAMQFALAAASN